MSKLLKHSALKFFSFSFIFLFTISLESKETIVLQEYLSNIEIAKNYQDRKKGLMFRESLADDSGMVFIWDRKKIQCMWMKNTLIPLSVAYLDDTGEIINIYDMVPLSKTSVCSKEPALYALEVNQGWFDKNDIHVGDLVDIKIINKMITKEEFQDYAKAGFNIIPVVKKVSLENQTPLTLYSQITDKSNTFLLESVEGGDQWAQFSIIGYDCLDTIKVSGNFIEINKEGTSSSFESEDPLGEIQKITESHKAPEINGLPRFYGGYVGFFAYESAQYAEKIAKLQSKDSKFKDHMPEIFLVKADKLIIYDNINKSTQVIFNANPSKFSYEDALDEIKTIVTSLQNEADNLETSFKEPTGLIDFDSNFTKKDYLNAVSRIKNYIEEGDVMQVVLAQDFSLPFNKNPFELYKAVRKLNPSPYMYYLDLEECQVVGSSPEILVRLEDNKVTLRPIAGTRRRGATPEEDETNQNDLLNDPKEIAEHLMLIDLGRNDVGKVSEIGSVKVTDKMVIEKYSHVMHIVSNVTGSLSKDLNYLDALKATLPAGTLSGAPKIRAMEIINELEPSSRGIYGGALGYISWNGNIDTAIAIRTAVIKDDVIHVGAGAGIVADSVPENEWLECKQKSKVFIDAMEMIS